MKLSVVTPVYNEKATLEEILKCVQVTPIEKEIIIVDDGSTAIWVLIKYRFQRL